MNNQEVKNIFGNLKSNFSNTSLVGRYRKAWTEESLYFTKTKGGQVITSSSQSYIGTSFTAKKAKFFFIFFIIVFLLVLSRIFFLQIIQGSNYRLFAEGNRQRIIPIPAERGLIYDKNGIQLTKNIPNFSLAIIPQDLPRNKEDRENIILELVKLTNANQDEIRHTLDEYGSYSYESIVIEEDIDYDTALSILIASGDLPGIQIQRSSKRLYLTDILNNNSFTTSTESSFSHILGYIGKLNKEELDVLYDQGYLPSDNIGKVGIEKTYEDFLRGNYGRRRIEVNSTGKEQSVIAVEEPKPGFHIKLAIDAKMQQKLEEILSTTLKLNNKTRASGVVINPKNGEVLALVSLPSFDNNDFSGGIDQITYKKYIENDNHPLFNRAIAGTFPSGSVIKPGMGLAALEEGIVTPNTSFLSTGGLAVGAWFFPDWALGGHGVTNLRKALAWSINTYFYYIGGGYNDFVGLGVDKITAYLSKMGFSHTTGIDLPGEEQGFLPSKEWKDKTKGERWYVGDTYNLSIGQGDLLITPIQMANYTSFLANRGTLYKPHVVHSIIDPISKEEQIIDPEVISENDFKISNIDAVRLGMKDCVDYGSCHRLAYLPFSSAGKTGTAQWNSNKDNHAWFTAFAPFENPKIVITVLIEEGGEGGIISSPVAYEFLQWWGTYTKQ